jgi:hypothetical protein
VSLAQYLHTLVEKFFVQRKEALQFRLAVFQGYVKNFYVLYIFSLHK